MWDPHSYVSQVIGAARHRNAPLFTSPYETVYEKQQHSKLLSEAVAEERTAWNKYSVSDAGDWEVSVYVKNTRTIPPEFIDALKLCVSAAWRSISDDAPEFDEFCGSSGLELPSTPNGNVREVKQQCFLATAAVHLCGAQNVDALVVELPCVTAVVPGASWMAGIKGIPFVSTDTEFLTHTYQLSGDATVTEPATPSTLFLVSASAHTEASHGTNSTYVLSIIGDSVSALLRAVEKFSDSVSADIAQFLMRLATDVQVHDFFCACSDGTETCRDAALELEKLKIHGGGHAWNARAHAEKCVRVGNTADAMHLLETNTHNNAKNTGLSNALVNLLVGAVPVAHVVITVCATNGDIISQLCGSFQLLDGAAGCGCVSVPRNSPLFNYFSASHLCNNAGISVVFLHNQDVAQFRSSGATQWLHASDTTSVRGRECSFYVPHSVSLLAQQSAHSFTPCHSFEIGDCAVFSGDLARLFPDECSPAVLLQGPREVAIPAGGDVVTPILCTMMHRTYGRVGVVATAVTICSTCPPCLLINVSDSDCGSILDENSIDPNVALYTFSPHSTLFDGRAYSSVIADLPFPMVELTDASHQSEFQHELHCRLIRVESYGSRGRHVCVLSVTKIVGTPQPCKTLVYPTM